MKKAFCLFCIISFFFSCSKEQYTGIPIGKHRLVLNLDTDINLGVLFDVVSKDSFFIYNSEERILITDIIQNSNDTLVFRMPVFDSQFKLVNSSKEGYQGVYSDYARGSDYNIGSKLELNTDFRFYPIENNSNPDTLERVYEMYFGEHHDIMHSGKGVFKISGGSISGTIMTPTGDYRYLEGAVVRDGFLMSAFDGAHAFLFTGNFFNDSISGTFYSGSHYKEEFKGKINTSFQLPKPDRLTKKVKQKFEFAFPNLSGDTLFSNSLLGRPLLIQIMGSWCPNCMDETRFLTEYYKNRRPENVEFITLAFERHKDSVRLVENLYNYISTFSIEYPVLLASNTLDKSVASEKLPALDTIWSYPTTVFLNSSHEIEYIHTGFNGPATGEPYYDFIQKFDEEIMRISKQ